ncbi:MAG TPA: Spy/CpxP family protein refolding chaperone, partial [Hyphomicrobiaceae bacterium]|nr:Spy/CpxP family protein refolding chaperone [Hyphomicrobiaceae bacterium]
LAQATSAPPAAAPQARERPARPPLSDETLDRLQDGRIAMMREALKLSPDQLKLWAPVEQQLRAGFKARRDARAERRQRMEQRRAGNTERPSLVDRLDRASKRMTERAQRMQAFTDAFKPFYAALNDEQKAVAGIVLHDARRGMGGPGRRWAMEHHFRGERAPDGSGNSTQPR